MIFQHTWQQVLDGSKTQTRRLVQANDIAHSYETVYGIGIHWVMRYSQGYPGGRLVYEVSKTYSVQPSRGKPSVGRVKLLAIRRERLQEITEDEAKQEGVKSRFVPGVGYLYKPAYVDLWDSIRIRKGEQWQDNPEVWVLTFELCKDGEE